MRKLHPDRVGSSQSAAQALDVLQEAKSICERALSRLMPPACPCEVKATIVCDVPGRRRVRVTWTRPAHSEDAPVRRYLVAGKDPNYGRSVTLAVLEPDYCEKLGRFVSIDELCSY